MPMRSFLVGSVLLLLLAGSASAQATGQVTALGFQGHYRPDCWTPLLVQLRSTISDPQEYQIQVHQQDLDKDTVVYTRVVTLNAQAAQDFWVYFIPQPTDGGLPAGGGGVALQDVLRVELYDKAGKRQIARLPVNVPVLNIDPNRAGGPFGGARGRKLVLSVLSRDKPAQTEYYKSKGLLEDAEFVAVSPRDLPDNVLGYQGVDSIVWFDADTKDITGTESTVFDAIQRWVRWGGQLVVFHPTDQPSRINLFADADMLPVVAKTGTGENRQWAIGVYTKPDLDPLVQIARLRQDDDTLPAAPVLQRRGAANPPGPVNTRGRWAQIEQSKPEWEFAFARPKPEAVVDAWIEWDPEYPGYKRTPYIARWPYGLGSVVWVAHDLGEPTLTAGSFAQGWPYVWDQVFGWKNDTYTELDYGRLPENRQNIYQQGSLVDLGPSLLKGMEHTSRGAALILLAVLFFIAYWVVAGPGSYLFLAQKRRKGLSWMAYAVAAVAATGVTLLVVNLVLRGSATAKHVSVVRLVAAAPAADGSARWAATVHSRFGLYIPKDDKQEVAVTDTSVGEVNYLVPFAIHPQHLGENKGFTDRARYEINFDNITIDPDPEAKEGDKTTGRPVMVEVPYRNTLKKLEGLWTGTVPWGFSYDATLPPALTRGGSRPDPNDPLGRRVLENSILEGRVINKTGRALKNVYFAFNYKWHDMEARDRRSLDWVLFVPVWGQDAVIDLAADFTSAKRINSGAVPGQAGVKVRGTLDPTDWPEFWYGSLKSGMGESSFDDHGQEFRRSHPMLTLFGRYGPHRTPVGSSVYGGNRHEILRRRGRELDMSQQVAAGQLVIFAQADGPMPLPLEVNGDRIEGEGVTFFQAALPLRRDRLVLPPKPATTRSTTRPTTRPAPDPLDLDLPTEPDRPAPPTDPAALGPAPARRAQRPWPPPPLPEILSPAGVRWNPRPGRW